MSRVTVPDNLKSGVTRACWYDPEVNPSYLELARRHNIPITTEIRLFIERCAAPINGVTGTKGKSTTTALLGEMLRQKYTTHVGGNIGRSLLFDLPNIKSDHQVVLEISSFMLEYSVW